MIFNTRSNLAGTHAFLSPSNPAWVNYDEDKLDRVFHTARAAAHGSALHAFAHDAIRLRIKLPDTKNTLNMYINDAIGYGMTPEQILYYSDNCYGHADCVGFRNNTLRIHDLKTGFNEASMQQLKIYAGLFCLEYRFKPSEIAIELRIYQNNNVKLETPDPSDIFLVMDRIRTYSKRIDYLRAEVSS